MAAANVSRSWEDRLNAMMPSLPRAILFVIVLLCAWGSARSPGIAQTTVFSSPAPTLDHPRKIVMSLSERSVTRQNEIINNIANTQKYYGPDYVRIALIVYGPGIHAVLQHDSKVSAAIEGLTAIGVEVYACETTLRTIHRPISDLLPGVKVVPNGIPAIVEREVAGWTYIRP